jgi:hypothetical protein
MPATTPSPVSQITVRAPADLIIRVKQEAAAEGKSMNEFVVHVLEITIDPERATTDDERLMARLRAAGLLQEPDPDAPLPVRPDPELVAAARRRAGQGTPSEVLIRQDRDG